MNMSLNFEDNLINDQQYYNIYQNIEYYDIGYLENNEIDLGDKEIKLENNEIDLRDKEIKLENNEIDLREKEIKLENNEINLGDIEIKLEDNNKSCKKNKKKLINNTNKTVLVDNNLLSNNKSCKKNNKKCIICKKKGPIYGFPNTNIRLYCCKCNNKRKDTINLIVKRCLTCDKIASYGYINSIKQYCNDCKLDDMFNLRKKY
jgi:hypothetical protein